MEIINKSPEVVESYTIDGKTYFDYGTINKGQKTGIVVGFKGKDLTSVVVSSTCSCTVAAVEKIDQDNYQTKISYNSNIIGGFHKILNLTSQQFGQPVKHTQLIIKGTVKDVSK